jgi:hypothetical protein
MNCIVVQKLLSAYYDGELTEELRVAVAKHVDGCAECAEALYGFQRLSELSEHLEHAQPPDQWTALERQLAPAMVPPKTVVKQTRSRSTMLSPITSLKRFSPRASSAAAAMILLAATLAVSAYNSGWFSTTDHHDEQLTATFDAYLTQFEQDPQAAQQVLLVTYSGRQVDLGRAAMLVGHQPAVAPGLPSGYLVDALYVLDMPCCKCTQVLCRRDGQGRLAIFEHDADQPVWFGERPAIQARCCGKSTRIVEVNSGLLAATWRLNKRYLTVIGARDVEEITRIVAHFEDTGENLQ